IDCRRPGTSAPAPRGTAGPRSAERHRHEPASAQRCTPRRPESHVWRPRGKGYIWRARDDIAAAFSAFGLDLWFKPLVAIRGWSRVRPLRAHLLHMAQRLPQAGEPGVLVLADQPHAPGERVTAAAGAPGVHERVQHAPLRLAEPGHHRDGKCGEHHLAAVTDHAPGHLAAKRVLRLPGDLDPRVTRLLAELPAAADGRRL